MSDSLAEVNSKSGLREKAGLPATLILAGGLGTRLRSAYAAGPKSMAPVGGRPFLDYLLRWLRSQGVKEVILCVGYKRAHIQRYVGKGRKWGLRVKYSIEKKLLGTGGAVKKAQSLIPGETFFVINGDTFLDVNLSQLARFHRSRRAFATMAVIRLANYARYGSLKMNRGGRITAFLEKQKARTDNDRVDRIDRKQPINGGVYLFEKSLLSKIPPRVPISLETKLFPWLAARKRTFGFVNDTYFVDIGVPDDLRRAQNELPQLLGIGNSR
jgi:D-glycero-alpha-D-manno-heptose 1-phosphate guanylyltransferase